jgi:hypothetical protein
MPHCCSSVDDDCVVKLSPVDGQVFAGLARAGASFGLGPLISALKVDTDSFHSVFRCEFERGVYALKRLVRRPDLPRWNDRFERALAVETWLVNHYSFIARPVTSVAGQAVAVVPSTSNDGHFDWFIAHRWVAGERPTNSSVTSHVRNAIGLAVSSIARVPLELVSSNDLMDDDVPSIQQIIGLLEHWRRSDTFVAQQCQILQTAVQLAPAPCLCPTKFNRSVVGHRDLSPANVLLTGSSSVFILDWENTGLSTLELEVGRVLVHWCMGPNDSPPIGISDVLIGLGPYLHSLNGVSEYWFSSWLGGHLMFLQYLLKYAQGQDILPGRACAELRVLANFVKNMSNLLEETQNVMTSLGWSTR